MVMVFRWVESEFYAYQVFTGRYVLPTIQSATIVSAIEDALARYNLPLCSHVVSAMMGRVTWLESRMVL